MCDQSLWLNLPRLEMKLELLPRHETDVPPWFTMETNQFNIIQVTSTTRSSTTIDNFQITNSLECPIV